MSKKPSRLEQLGYLLTAMISIIASGSSDLLTENAPIPSRNPLLAEIDLRDFRRHGKYWGLAVRVAQQLRLSHSHVHRVLLGDSQSLRVAQAISDEMKLIDKQSAPSPINADGLSAEEISEFSRGGRYFGLKASVAKQLGISQNTVCKAARDPKNSRPTYRAIRAEMARVDADIAAKSGGRK